MKLTPESDLDMIDIQGSGDAAEEAAGGAEDDSTTVNDAETQIDDGEGLMKVLKAFMMLQENFNAKFKEMWA
jgi:hypothetical protein